MKNLRLILAGIFIIGLSYAHETDKETRLHYETSFSLPDEAYIDDIPFNTSEIIKGDLDTSKDVSRSKTDSEFMEKLLLVSNLMKVDFIQTDEEYIDDIPFDTQSVFACYQANLDSSFNKAMDLEFQMENEEYIDDIPFNTNLIVRTSMH